MGKGWRDLAGHHGWTTAELLTYCQGLDAATLNATAPGTYGTIIETLRHLLDAEMSYVFRLTRAWTERPWTAYEAVGIDVLQERAALLAETLDRFLADDWDDERLGEGYGDDQVFDVRAGVFLAQTIHHAGALGHEPPDVSAWGYAVAAGRSTPRPSPEV